MRTQELTGAEQAAADALCQLVDGNETLTAVLAMLQHPQQILNVVRALALQSACACSVQRAHVILCQRNEHSFCCRAHALGLRRLRKQCLHESSAFMQAQHVSVCPYAAAPCAGSRLASAWLIGKWSADRNSGGHL